MDELYALAEEHDGLLTSKEARALGIQDSVLVRLAQRGRLERMSRGVYRIAHYPTDRLAQYREAVLWAQANHHGPERIALSHETALLIYGISDLNPSRVHLTVPKSARLRRERPEWITIHQADLAEEEVDQNEGIPVTTVARSIMDVLSTTHRTEIARQAVTEALRGGLLNSTEATKLRKIIGRTAPSLSRPTDGNKATAHESTTS
jgi:predicted transcriptional regulator of viral defense system